MTCGLILLVDNIYQIIPLKENLTMNDDLMNSMSKIIYNFSFEDNLENDPFILKPAMITSPAILSYIRFYRKCRNTNGFILKKSRIYKLESCFNQLNVKYFKHRPTHTFNWKRTFE